MPKGGANKLVNSFLLKKIFIKFGRTEEYNSSVFFYVKKIFDFLQKIFQKPIDKRQIFAIIKVQKERTKQKMLISFIKNGENTDEHIVSGRGKSASSRRDTAQGERVVEDGQKMERRV